MKTLSRLLIRFYQKFLSVFSYGSCRYYPSCSEYAIWQLENNSFFKAIYFTMTRILRCNQLFPGGFDYPHVKCKKSKILFKKIKVKYWFVPIDEKNCIITKNRDWDKKI